MLAHSWVLRTFPQNAMPIENIRNFLIMYQKNVSEINSRVFGNSLSIFWRAQSFCCIWSQFFPRVSNDSLNKTLSVFFSDESWLNVVPPSLSGQRMHHILLNHPPFFGYHATSIIQPQHIVIPIHNWQFLTIKRLFARNNKNDFIILLAFSDLRHRFCCCCNASCSLQKYFSMEIAHSNTKLF